MFNSFLCFSKKYILTKLICIHNNVSLNSKLVKLLWRGDINSATTTNLSTSGANYSFFIVKYAVGVAGYYYKIVGKFVAVNLEVISGSSSYPLTIYQRSIAIDDESFKTYSGNVLRYNSFLQNQDYVRIYSIYGLF